MYEQVVIDELYLDLFVYANSQYEIKQKQHKKNVALF